MLYKKAIDLIGNTPLVRLSTENIYLKLEKYNLTGSVKDRIALQMLNAALDEKIIKQDTIIIEATSGNTGISLAAVCAIKKMKCIIVMPSNMTKERISYIKGYGAKVVLTNAEEGMNGSVSVVKALLKRINNAYTLSQFDNINNPLAHYHSTAKEILRDLPNVDAVVAGIGSGGTISGVGKYIKKYKPMVKIIGVEPESSPLITKGKIGKHNIQGIGANFIPQNYLKEYVDEVITVTDEEAFITMKMLRQKEGIFVGISSGAALAAGRKLINKFQNIVVIMPDGGEKYLSMEGFFE